MRTVRVRLGAREGYDILAGPGVLARLGLVARASLSRSARRVVVVSNEKVFGLYGDRAADALRAAGFAVETFLVGDGERHKTLRTAERALDFFSGCGLERTDAVVALGGGVVGDLAGFAAAVYLRGIDFIQAPTTLLAQVDASVGGKTGVNTRAGKNLTGAFHHPRAVVADTATLRTLPRRELTAGWCEAVKHGAVGGRQLFARTRDFIAARSPSPAATRPPGSPPAKPRGGQAETFAGPRYDERQEEELAGLIAEHCAFKARVVAADERESVERAGRLSRRVLNFGHTVGHALEVVTGYRRFRHGEAVGHGMVVAAEISHRLGLLPAAGLQHLRGAVALAGPLPRADDLDPAAILAAAAADKKSAGGQLHWVLLEDIGRARVVPANEVPVRVVREALRAGLASSARRIDTGRGRRMDKTGGPRSAGGRERGGARLNFLLALAVIAALVYVGSQFVPAQYHAWVFKRFMQDTVEAAVTTRKPPAWVEQQLRRNFEDNAIPEDASVEVARDGKRLKASVRYAQTISLLVTEYEYEHDVTVRSVTTLDGTL